MQTLTAWNTLAALNSTEGMILLIIGFGFLIFVHELGHFLVAKAVGIKVEQFAVGFGHALLCWRKGIGLRVGTTAPEYNRRVEAGADPETLGETEYRLNWIPFGGYVKMLGQDDMDPNASSDDPRAYNNQPIWQRVCVVSAGVVMNAFVAFIFFIAAFVQGVAFPPAEVGEVVPGSPAATATAAEDSDVVGLRRGDQVTRVNGEKPSDFTNIKIAAALAGPGDRVNLEVERPIGPLGNEGTQRHSFSIEPTLNPQSNLKHIGIAPPDSLQLPAPTAQLNPVFQRILDRHGLKPGMRLTRINGQPVEEYWQYHRLLDQAGGEAVSLRFEPTERTPDAEATAPVMLELEPPTELSTPDEGPPHLLGLVPLLSINAVMPDGPSEGKLRAGDAVVKVGDTAYPDMDELREAVGAAEGPVKLEVLRNGERKQLSIEPQQGRIGVILGRATEAPYIREVREGSPFEPLDLPPGSRIRKINQTETGSYTQLRRTLTQAGPGEVTVEYELPVAGGVTETASVTVEEPALEQLASLGWADPLSVSGMRIFQPLQVAQKANSVVGAVRLGLEKTGNTLALTYITLVRLIQGIVKPEHLRGPVGIVHLGTQVAERGIEYMIYFIGLISINLAVINFLPLPIVDGGLFVLLMVEKIRGKPVPPQVQSAINLIGLVLIGALFLTVTYHDIVRLTGLGSL
jgi:regulator of sigma E protease